MGPPYPAHGPELAALREENARLRQIIKGVHGALTDAGSVVVPGSLHADLYAPVMQIVKERDEARAALAEWRANESLVDCVACAVLDAMTCGTLKVEDLLDGLPRRSTPEKPPLRYQSEAAAYAAARAELPRPSTEAEEGRGCPPDHGTHCRCWEREPRLSTEAQALLRAQRLVKMREYK